MAEKLTEADVKAMDANDLYGALALIEQEIKTRQEGGFAESVREYLRKDADEELRAEVAAGGGAVAVAFPSDHWDDGFFYTESGGELILADSTVLDVDFHGTCVHDAVTELSHVQRREYGLDRYSVLAVDLLTGKVEHETRYWP